MPIPVTIGDRDFPSKKAVGEHCKEIGRRYPQPEAPEQEPLDDDCMTAEPPGVEVTEAEDIAFLHGLLERHPNYAQVFAGRVQGFTVLSYGTNYPAFYIVHATGWPSELKRMQCIDGKPPTQHARVKGALRAAVGDQVTAERTRVFGQPRPQCEVCSEELIHHEDAEVDHADPPFAELADAFIAEHGGIEQFEVAPRRRGGPHEVRLLADEDLEVAWKGFHGEQAMLRVVCKGCHGKRTSEQSKARRA
ncbi:hypothetical protein OG730_09905 [Streptomyces sp. NBC_01298]|uniref:hypothetical protein n=1 Tax=Streptomyces sp. NBC_01298 TaxID=2903817 RepID=UPI002E10C1C7|nr:hypothetical protein OG730_09905 [Streptomyces sp. NBC_01298]